MTSPEHEVKVPTELLPCPFCGADRAVLMHGGLGCWFVKCIECGADSDDGSKERAIAACNRRAPSSELLELREAAEEVIAQNRDYLTHLNNGAQTDPLTRAIEALARSLQSHTGEA